MNVVVNDPEGSQSIKEERSVRSGGAGAPSGALWQDIDDHVSHADVLIAHEVPSRDDVAWVTSHAAETLHHASDEGIELVAIATQHGDDSRQNDKRRQYQNQWVCEQRRSVCSQRQHSNNSNTTSYNNNKFVISDTHALWLWVYKIIYL